MTAPATSAPAADAPATAGRQPVAAAAAKPQAAPDDGFVAVGRVLAPFGLKGELKVQSLTENPRRFAPKSKLFAGQQPVTVAASREAGGHLYVTFKGHADRASAERFRHALLQVREADLPPLPEGEYYRFQLLGLDVYDRAGQRLGSLAEIIETGANDVYRVHPDEGPDMLIPALDDVIVSIDLPSKRMVVDPPPWR